MFLLRIHLLLVKDGGGCKGLEGIQEMGGGEGGVGGGGKGVVGPASKVRVFHVRLYVCMCVCVCALMRVRVCVFQ